MRLRYWQGIGLVIHRSGVRVLAGHHCIVVLGNLSPSSIIWYWPRGCSLAGKVTVGLVKSNLPPRLMTKSSAGWLPRNQDQLHAQHSQLSIGLLYFCPAQYSVYGKHRLHSLHCHFYMNTPISTIFGIGNVASLV